MILKAVTLFLIGMAVLAMFGKLRVPGSSQARQIREKLRTRLESRGKCPKCGAHIIAGECQCGGSGKPRGG